MNRAGSRGWSALVALACAGCASIFGLEEPTETGSTGAGGATPTSTSTGTNAGGAGQGGGQGGTAPTCDLGSCPAPANPCAEAVCDGTSCAEAAVADGTPCDGGVCVGEACVECDDAEDCTAPETCVDNACLSPECVNEQLDPGETDVDCGGDDCLPCEQGETCVVATDCASGYCPDTTCQPCTANANCHTSQYCDATAGLCRTKLGNGTACDPAIGGSLAQCTSTFCRAVPAGGGICCSAACDAACQACQMSQTGLANGMCGPVTAGLDPYGQCTASSTTCLENACVGGTAACALKTNQESCGAPACSGDTQIAPRCNATGACEGVSDDCAPYACTGGACATSCPNPGQTTGCASGYSCAIGNVCKLGLGQSCSQDDECATAGCVENVCCDNACSGRCESCLGAYNGGLDGFCGQVPTGTDPRNECSGVMVCNGMGVCE